MTMSSKWGFGAAVALAIVSVGCGSDDSSSSSAEAETVIVANGNADNGSAGRMTDALRLAGFSTGEAVNSQDKVADSIVYYSDDDGSQEVAVNVAVALGGVDVKSLPDPAPTDSGTVDGGGVLLLLGQKQADKTLDELTGGGGTTSTTPGGGTTDTTPIGGTVKCDKESLTAAAKNSVDNFVSLEDWNCDQGWAVAFVVTEDYEETVVFEAEGQFWIAKDRNDVCGTGPDDATIPSSLYDPGCTTN